MTIDQAKKLPPINTIIDFMDISWSASPRYKSGRILAYKNKYNATFAILNVNGKIYEVSRPHKAAPWKGREEQIGHYRGTDWWNLLLEHNLIPKEYFKPFTTKEKTLARLREVVERKKIIGGCSDFGIEERCSTILNGLYSFHHYLICYLKDEQEYLKEVYNNDKEEIDEAEYKYIEQQINSLQLYALYPLGYSFYNRPEVKIISLEEIKKSLYKHLREKIIEKVYNDLLPKWILLFKEENEKIIERKNKYSIISS